MSQDNPFYYNLPTRPADFMGRWPLVDDIVADLSRPRPDSWAVIGGRRFGKSSVLKAVEARLLEQIDRAAPGDRYIFPLIVDLKGSATQTEQNVYARIVRLLYRALRRRQDFKLDLTSTRLKTVVGGGAETLSFYQFEDTLDDLALHFEDHLGPLRLVLLLDEVEATTRFDWSETLFNQLRALIYDGPLADVVKLVLTGAGSVIRVRHEGSPLLNAVKITHLAVLPEPDLQALIARGGEISGETSAAIQEQSAGHPFIAQYLLHHLWADGLAQAAPAQVEQVAHQMRQQRAADLEGWWEAIEDSGQFVYAMLAETDQWLDEQTILAQITGTNQSIDQGLAALCYHGLAIRDPHQPRYRIGGMLFRDWFSQNAAQDMGTVDSGDKRLITLSHTDLVEKRQELQDELRRHRKSLAYLQEQKAQYGLHVPLDILHNIDNTQKNIERIEARLAEIDTQL
jgi:hypothetical protein